MWNINSPGTYFASFKESFTLVEKARHNQECVDVDKRKTEGNNVLAAADLRPAEKACCSRWRR